MPDSLRILDMQDMHSLRAGLLPAMFAHMCAHSLKQALLSLELHNTLMCNDMLQPVVRQGTIEKRRDLITALTTPPLATEPVLQRELAAIHRYRHTSQQCYAGPMDWPL